jgi:hypothetical protein
MFEEITIEECISRLDAIRHGLVSDSRDRFAMSAGIAALYELESNRAVDRWIPCSERQPDTDGRYYVTYERYFTPDHVNDIDHVTDTDLLYYSVKYGWGAYMVHAWQPLPEMYSVLNNGGAENG